MRWARIGPAVDVRSLFPMERAALLELLSTLSSRQWATATACPGWSVHDVVGHLTHDYLRRLSGHRDGHRRAGPAPGESLPAYIDRDNERFVAATRGLSPAVLVGILTTFGPQLDALWAGLDLAATGDLPVWWADPDAPAPAWLDVAREYTEFWVHQQQIRDAVGRPGADRPELLSPVIDTFLRAMPHTLRDTPAADGAVIIIAVGPPVSAIWTARRGPDGWSIGPGDTGSPTSDGPAARSGGRPAGRVRLEIAPDTLWRLATRGIDPEAARKRVFVEGDERLAEAALRLLSVIR